MDDHSNDIRRPLSPRFEVYAGAGRKRWPDDVKSQIAAESPLGYVEPRLPWGGDDKAQSQDWASVGHVICAVEHKETVSLHGHL